MYIASVGSSPVGNAIVGLDPSVTFLWAAPRTASPTWLAATALSGLREFTLMIIEGF